MPGRLRGVSFRGGQDNLPSLEVAWDLASAVEDGAVLLHAGQEVYYGLNAVGARIWQLLPPSDSGFLLSLRCCCWAR